MSTIMVGESLVGDGKGITEGFTGGNYWGQYTSLLSLLL